MSEPETVVVDYERALAIALARWLVGLMFFMAGVWKVFILGPVEHARSMFAEGYADTFLPEFSLWITGWSIPWIELIAGGLLILGLGTRPALTALAAVLVIVTFGHLLAQPLYSFQGHVLPRGLLMLFVLAMPRHQDAWSLDAWRRRRARTGTTA